MSSHLLSRRTVLGCALAAATATSAVTGVSACSKGGSDDDGGAPTKIVMLVLGDKPTNGRLEKMLDKLNAVLVEKVNATLDLFYVEWADWQTQYNVQLLGADGNIDLITVGTDWLFTFENAGKGAFLPLDEDLMKANAPKTWAQVDGKGDWDLCKLSDGQIYFIPEDNYTQWTNHGFFYRGDWATSAGIADGTITQFEQFTQYWTWVKKNQKKAFPWDVAGSNQSPLTGYLQGHTDANTIQQVSAGNFYPFQTSAADPYTVTSWYMESDAMVPAAQLAKQWNTLGVWREDALNYDGDTREELYSALSGTDQHHTQTFVTGVWYNLSTRQKGSNPKMFWWGQENKNIFRDLKTHGGMAVSATSNHPEKALQLYDLLRNDEQCYRLINFGIEGSDYVIKDGMLTYPDGYDPTKDALGANFWGGRMDEFELPRATDDPDAKQLYTQLGGLSRDYPYSTLLINKDQIDSSLAAMGSVLSTYIPQLQYGKFDDPASAVTKMRAELAKADYEDVKASIQKDMDDWAKDKGLK